jgi:hypothetical protein
MDRALNALAIKLDGVTDADGQKWTFDEWFSGGGGDLERVGRTRDIANQLAEQMDMANLGLSEVCYEVLEEELESYIELFTKSNAESPTDDEICTFIQERVDVLRKKLSRG